MISDTSEWEVYYRGSLLGTATTDKRHALIRETLSQEEIDRLMPGDIEFRLVKA